MSYSYFLPEGYTPRIDPMPFYDTGNTDEWQREVYEQARWLWECCNLDAVLDVGCGSGYKLVREFPSVFTTGVDVKETVEVLNNKYPNRVWISNDNVNYDKIYASMLICADVIEHVVDANRFISELLLVHGVKFYVFSTPDRDLVRSPADLGPPANLSHVREWSREEFRKYLSQFFVVRSLTYSNLSQGTMMAVCVRR